MNPDISFLHDLWDSVKTFIPKKERLPVAETIVRNFDQHADIGAIEESINEFDQVMRTALISHFDIGLEEDEDDEDYGDWG
jgi:hypothetical protein